MKTLMLLLVQYDGAAVIPIEKVCQDYFRHLTPEALTRKVSRAEIPLPLVRIEASNKSAKGVHVTDLAEYIDARAEAARKELRQLTF